MKEEGGGEVGQAPEQWTAPAQFMYTFFFKNGSIIKNITLLDF